MDNESRWTATTWVVQQAYHIKSKLAILDPKLSVVTYDCAGFRNPPDISHSTRREV